MSDNRYEEPSQPVDRSGVSTSAVAAILAVIAILTVVAYVAMLNDTRKTDAVETAAMRIGNAAQDISTPVPAHLPASAPAIQINMSNIQPAPAAPVRAPEATPPTLGITAPSESADASPAN